MNKEKALEIAMLPPVDFAAYKAKRNLRSSWQKLNHEEWVSFCTQMSEWLSGDAHNQWDEQVIANNKRKAQSDEDADIENIKKKRRK